MITLRPLVEGLTVLTKERGLVKFRDVMNPAQSQLLDEVERQLNTGGQVNIIVLKARQIGISTMIEAILFACSMLFDDFNSLILSYEVPSSQNILKMTKRFWKHFAHAEFYQPTYNGASHLAWTNGSEIEIKTAKNEKAGRSGTIRALHGTEVAFWTEGEDLMTSLRNAIPDVGISLTFLESTAEGIGNFFYKTWKNAQRTAPPDKRNEYTPMFFPWHEYPEYTAQNIPAKERGNYKLLSPLDDPDDAAEEARLRKAGVTDEQLLWRRWCIAKKCGGDINKFHQEYPYNPAEAFLASGHNVFPIRKLLSHYDPRSGTRGRIAAVASGRGVQFIENAEGHLTVFRAPTPDRNWGQYIIAADPTHSLVGDYAVAQVVNRRTLEQVAIYRAKIDPIAFARVLHNLSRYYHNALIVPEREGPGYATVGALATMGANVYRSTRIDHAQRRTVDVLGWSTNMQSKQHAIMSLLSAVNEQIVGMAGESLGLVIHDEQTLTEMRDYITIGDTGKQYGNGDGSDNDDTVMSLAMAFAVHYEMPPVPMYEGPTTVPAPVTRPFQSGTGAPPTVPIDEGLSMARGTSTSARQILDEQLPGWDQTADFADYVGVTGS